LLLRPVQDPAGWDANSAQSGRAHHARDRNALAELFSPATILTADKNTFKRSPSSRRRASLARSSTGGTVSAAPSAPLDVRLRPPRGSLSATGAPQRNLTIALLNLNPKVPALCRTIPSSPDWTFSAHLDSKGIKKNDPNPQIVTLIKIVSSNPRFRGFPVDERA
jgi:hypothetical protein